MTNAKKEFIEHTGDRLIKCASIEGEKGFTIAKLDSDFDVKQLKAFLKAIDFKYDSGYGGQELYGMIWYEDGTWSHRGEYDGSEWWEHNECPEIPDELKTNGRLEDV